MNPGPRSDWHVGCTTLDAGWPPAFSPGAPFGCGEGAPVAASVPGFRQSPS